ncbi:MAG: hypothetical protein P1P80_04905 [ANME-2 cluster archaeon]|nr:hypothetical protein [ANME-2 cluster archaeon]
MKTTLAYSEDAISEVIGYILLLGIIVISVGLVTMLAMPIIEDAKENAYLKNMEQGFTVLDSKASLVALGKSPTQLVQMYSQAGDITVYNQSTSHMTVSLINGSNTSDTIEIYNESLGTVVYRLGENRIAYEGGGVFRKYPGEGDPIAITPPEFYYNGETLTLPIIRVDSNQSVGGSGVVSMYLISNNTPNVLYPNTDLDPEFRNPLLIGKTIDVVIRSDYYMGWAKYIEERTKATVNTNDATKEVRVQLNTKPNDQSHDLDPPIGVFGFNMTNESSLINFSMLFGYGASNFDFLLTTSTTETEPYFEFNAKKSGGLNDSGVTITLNYFDTPGTETWTWDVRGLKVGNDFDVDFLSNGSVVYTSNDDSWTWDDEAPPDNQTYNKSANENGPSGRKIFSHYMSEVGPSFSLTPGNQPGDPAYPSGFNPDNSTYILYYDVTPPSITYLHLVEHTIQVNVI